MVPTSIALVEPSQLFREGVRQLLHKPPFLVVAAVRTAAGIFDGAEPIIPDLVIWGPGVGDAAEAQMAWVRERCPKPQRVRFVLLADAVDARWIRQMAAAGADAVLSQDISGEVMQRSLDLVMLGQQLFPATLALAPGEGMALSQAEVIAFPRPGARIEQRGVVLSARESQILRCLVDGASNKAIARELNITETTVKAHVKGLLRKVRASNRTQAAIWALNNNVLFPGAVGPVEPPLALDVPGRHAVG